MSLECTVVTSSKGRRLNIQRGRERLRYEAFFAEHRQLGDIQVYKEKREKKSFEF